MKIEIIMNVIIFIIFFVLFVIFAYLLYDYIEYKGNVDKSFEISTKHINTSFDKISQNISSTDAKLNSTIQVFTELKEKINKNPVDKNNLKVCDEKNSCINFNTTDGVFNITSENANAIIINSIGKKPMAKFDMKNNNIYLGGSDMNAPFFIQDNNVYVQNIHFVKSGEKITPENVKNNIMFGVSANDIDMLKKNIEKSMIAYNQYLELYTPILGKHVMKFAEENEDTLIKMFEEGNDLFKKIDPKYKKLYENFKKMNDEMFIEIQNAEPKNQIAW